MRCLNELGSAYITLLILVRMHFLIVFIGVFHATSAVLADVRPEHSGVMHRRASLVPSCKRMLEKVPELQVAALRDAAQASAPYMDGSGTCMRMSCVFHHPASHPGLNMQSTCCLVLYRAKQGLDDASNVTDRRVERTGLRSARQPRGDLPSWHTHAVFVRSYTPNIKGKP